MKSLLGIGAFLIAFGLSLVGQAVAQTQRMSPADQDRFNGYYTRWIEDKRTGDRDDMLSMEHHMQDLMSRYQIPSSTPYEEVAAQNAAPAPRYADRVAPPPDTPTTKKSQRHTEARLLRHS